jgi:hypothetical protein
VHRIVQLLYELDSFWLRSFVLIRVADEKLLIVTLSPAIIIGLISLGYVIPLLILDRRYAFLPRCWHGFRSLSRLCC